MNHSPEPWTLSDYWGGNLVEGSEIACARVLDANRCDIHSGEMGINNARRIVACVNALAGIDDPAAWVAQAKETMKPAAEPADIEPDDSDRGKIVEVRGDSRLWLRREFLERSGDGLFVCKSALANRDFRGWKHARRIREA